MAGTGGAREGAGRKRTAADGKVRKQRQLRASDEEWEIIRQFAKELKSKRKLENENEKENGAT